MSSCRQVASNFKPVAARTVTAATPPCEWATSYAFIDPKGKVYEIWPKSHLDWAFDQIPSENPPTNYKEALAASHAAMEGAARGELKMERDQAVRAVYALILAALTVEKSALVAK